MEYLDDLDYADDLVVLACTQARIREKNEKLWQPARRVGLEINAPKSKMMCINTSLDAASSASLNTRFLVSVSVTC